MAKRYYNLEKETKEYLKALNSTNNVWTQYLDTAYVNDSFIKTKSFGITINELTGPIVVSGLQLWLDASDTNSLATLTNAPSSNVGTWGDKSGFGRHALNTDLNNTPVRIDNAKNGKTVLRFNGTTSRLNIFRQIPMGDSFAVFKRSANNQTVFQRGDNANFRGFLGSAYPGFTTHLTYRVNNGSAANAAPTTATGANYFIVQGTSVQYSLGTIIVGYDYPAYAFLNGDVCEILIYNKTLSENERLFVLNYLNFKWAIY
jgi:hypothetical protein